MTKGRGRGRGRSSSVSSKSSYGSSSSSNTPIIQRGGMSLVKLNSKTQEKTSSSIHLEDIPESDPLYAKLQEYITQKQSNTFASIAREDTIDDIKTYEKVEKREMIFLLENSDIQRREETWKIFQRYLLNGLYFPGESYKTRKYYETLLISTGVEFQHFAGYNTGENVYNFSKMIVKQIIHIEDWGISSMTERQISLNNVKISFTYWDYIQAFDKVLCYNNERHKHTWFIKVCAKIFASPIPNWFLNWWSYHGPTIKILPEPFLKTIKEYNRIPNKGIVTDDSTSVKHMARRISNHDEEEKNQMILDYLEEIFLLDPWPWCDGDEDAVKEKHVMVIDRVRATTHGDGGGEPPKIGSQMANDARWAQEPRWLVVSGFKEHESGNNNDFLPSSGPFHMKMEDDAGDPNF
ncbi:hypothetical protein H5410_059889 [Solanum commersonii]|uniref:Uncharacterized protein n=1 Tax=Solanum commersonii TaxID=4109 RepID=A0A9J5W3L1_SOLCO|nr:hypothetical protein H5410_059889 [Solanum commersonii]